MKDLILKMLKSIFEAVLKVAIEAVKNVKWQSVAYKSYMEFRPSLLKKVEDSKSKVDNAAVKALDIIVDKFLKPDEENAE